jgi:hypothetical protein
MLPDDTSDLRAIAPLGISCAALAYSDRSEVTLWHGVPEVNRETSVQIVAALQQALREGYTLLTWNGCHFDLQILAQASGMVEACSDVALSHVDLMVVVTFTKGYYLSLEKALQGADVSGKITRVTLASGASMDQMSGALAPQLWARGEHQAVLDYLQGDVNQLLALAKVIEKRKALQWKSNSGRPQAVRLTKFPSVRECFGIPAPDVSWMSNPPTRRQFVDWMPADKIRGL